jgi:hypothetical protein
MFESMAGAARHGSGIVLALKERAKVPGGPSGPPAATPSPVASPPLRGMPSRNALLVPGATTAAAAAAAAQPSPPPGSRPASSRGPLGGDELEPGADGPKAKAGGIGTPGGPLGAVDVKWADVQTPALASELLGECKGPS